MGIKGEMNFFLINKYNFFARDLFLENRFSFRLLSNENDSFSKENKREILFKF